MAAVLLAALALTTSLVPSPPPPPPCSQVRTTNCADVSADGDGFASDVTKKEPARPAGGRGPAQIAPVGPAPAVVVQTLHVPTCSGNRPEGANDALCGAAVTTCPVPGEVRFWVFTRRFDRVARVPVTGWIQVTDPGTVCIGPDDPVLDPTVALPALIEREFKRVVVRKGVAEVSPAPETLVNIPTLFTTSSPGSYDIPLTLLGQSVVITAKAQRWTWHFGDGATASTAAAGTQGRVEHEYRATGSRGAYVVIEWSGTFSVNGGPARPILGTATTTGDPAQVEVRQARSELVDSSS